ncbi:hypothetical protein [Phenylobacterium sp. NIBR 498073]|uniref:hypothetical protein n=1 Tax=Phenylobacterium sp. NIBR 498073 TaxID=3015177 RepID=UPI0022B56505|nr:hypothetical protein [Phenylobacterium sp. NIBR 498073]WGU39136.1 hypothetical protein O4N75_15970 [Phenylobacterium sp. NIBR 498073]
MTMPQIAGPLAAALDVVAEGCADLADPWWVFGSAGMALVGVPGLTPPDVDLIVSERDARRLLDRWNTAPHAAAASPLFRSAIFAKAQVAALPIEIMAGFEAYSDGAWAPVLPATRQALDWQGRRLFTPSAAEQAAICRRFGRPKDLARIALLEALI